VEDPDFGLLHEILEYCLAYPDQYHHPKEDLNLCSPAPTRSRRRRRHR
jgi:hemerythrin-like domain-containing protein